MPRAADPARRSTWAATGDAMEVVADLIAAVVVWGAIGFGLDRWLGTEPVLMVIGALVGHGAGIYMVIHRGKKMIERENERRGIRRVEQ